MVIFMLKIRRPLGRLIFNMGIAIPGKTVFLIETAPWTFVNIFLKHGFCGAEIKQEYWFLQDSFPKHICTPAIWLKNSEILGMIFLKLGQGFQQGQAIIWTSDCLLLNHPLGTNFIEIWMNI